jgi:hypothetical protein
MSEDSLWLFQRMIYLKLSTSKKLMEEVKAIYHYKPENTQFPYIQIGKLAVQDWSSFTSTGLGIEMVINIYSQGKSNKTLLRIISLVRKLLFTRKMSMESLKVIKFNFQSVEVIQMPGSEIFHASLKLQSLIEE